MRRRTIIAMALFFLSSIQIADWIIFASKNDNKKLNIAEINAKYIERFPHLLQVYFRNPLISTLVCSLLFVIAGLIFINEKKKIYFALGIISFVLAFWQLFTLM